MTGQAAPVMGPQQLAYLILQLLQQQQQRQQQQQAQAQGKAIGDLVGTLGKSYGVKELISGGGPEVSMGPVEPIPGIVSNTVTGSVPSFTSSGSGVQSVGLGPAEKIPTTFGNFSSMGIGPQAGIAAGLLAGAKGLKDIYNRKPGTDSIEGLAGRATLGIATGGLSEVARALGVGKKSTKDYQKERRKELRDRGDVGAADFLEAARKRKGPSAGWKEGEKWNFGKAKQLAKEDPHHFIGTYANFQVAGDDWFHIGEDKQREFVKRALDEDLYSSDKGNVLFSGKKGHLNRAKEIYQEVLTSPSQPSGGLKTFGQGGEFSWNDNELFKLVNDADPKDADPGFQISEDKAKELMAGGNASPQTEKSTRKSLSSSASQPVPRPVRPGPAPSGDAVAQILERYGEEAAANYNPEGGVGGPGYDPDPNRPGHFIRR